VGPKIDFLANKNRRAAPKNLFSAGPDPWLKKAKMH